jgi:hypothetical protein
MGAILAQQISIGRDHGHVIVGSIAQPMAA